MSIDGVFVHYLTNELKAQIEGAKINKIYQPNPLEIILQLRCGKSNYQLLISATLDAPRIYLTNEVFVNPSIPGNFCMLLRKYIERGIITNITQLGNDRLIELTINTYDELQDNVDYKLIIELMGRNSNVILINNENIIIDAIRKLPPSDNNERYIIPKAVYHYPHQEGMINPFSLNESESLTNLQGISTLAKKELVDFYYSALSNKYAILKFLTQPLIPALYKTGNKTEMYCFKLLSINDNLIQTFDSLSSMLEFYYSQTKKTINYQNNNLIKQVKRLITHQITKQNNLKDDLEKAFSNLIYKDLGILLQANLYLVKKGMTEITVCDFLHEQKPTTIMLDPLLEPSQNLKAIFAKGRKASSAITNVNKQLSIVENEIAYLEEILIMLEFATNSEIDEIRQDLLLNSDVFASLNRKQKNHKVKKLAIFHFEYEGVTFYVGKNNLQNDYLTNKLARNNDYWFHVKDSAGAHIVISIPHNDDSYELNEKQIRLAANLASYYSKMTSSSSVPVDYTKIKYIKKIPGTKGYHVTYTHQRTIYIDPDIDLIKEFLRK